LVRFAERFYELQRQLIINQNVTQLERQELQILQLKRLELGRSSRDDIDENDDEEIKNNIELSQTRLVLHQREIASLERKSDEILIKMKFLDDTLVAIPIDDPFHGKYVQFSRNGKIFYGRINYDGNNIAKFDATHYIGEVEVFVDSIREQGLGVVYYRDRLDKKNVMYKGFFSHGKFVDAWIKTCYSRIFYNSSSPNRLQAA